MNNDKAINQYCERYAEIEIQSLQNFPPQHFRHLIVIPAHREEGEFLTALQQLAEQQRETLLILVINRPDDEPENSHDKKLWDLASTCGQPLWSNDKLKLLGWQNHSGLLLVDRFTADRGIPRKQGVGLARKIGCDIGLALYRQGKVKANFIHNTDADARLPADYLQQTARLTKASAVLYPFTHVGGDRQINHATALYERSLHYYVDGLRWAGSPYAFHTIGSCMAISLGHYAQARGFPKRAGGEDFYLLNKLAKLGPVIQAQGEAIRLSARRSDRVPFGTGPAVEKIINLSSDRQFTTYAPESFVELARLLRGFQSLWDYRDNYSAWLSQFSAVTQETCSALGIEKLFNHLQKQANNERHCVEYAHDWFDAFRTLKFVRHLQSHYYPSVPFSAAENRARLLWQAK